MAQQPEASAQIDSDAGSPSGSGADRDDDLRSRREKERQDEAAIVEEMKRTPIRMYTTQWCPHCTRARAWLSANGYGFTEYDVEVDDRARRVRDRLNPKKSVPTIDVDGVTLVGFSQQRVERTLRQRAKRRLGL